MIYRRRYRWTEMSLLLFPAAFMAVALIELQLAQNAATPLTRNILNPLDTLGPAIGLVFALAVTHVLLNIFAPDSDHLAPNRGNAGQHWRHHGDTYRIITGIRRALARRQATRVGDPGSGLLRRNRHPDPRPALGAQL